MDEKKVREAIKYFEHLKDVLENYLKMPNPEENLGVEIVFIKSDIEIYNTAIEALEKQLPKKGIKEKITEGANKGLHKFYCPVCYKKGDLSNKCNVGEYCSDCGQKIDWSE